MSLFAVCTLFTFYCLAHAVASIFLTIRAHILFPLTSVSFMSQLMTSSNAPRCIQIHVFYRFFLRKKREQKTVEVHLPSTLFHLNKDKMPSRIHSFVPRVFFSAEAFFSRGKKVQLHSKQCPCDEFKLAQPLAAHFFATPKNDMNNVSKM